MSYPLDPLNEDTEHGVDMRRSRTIPPLAQSALTMTLAFLIALAIVWSGADRVWLAQIVACRS